MTSDDVARRIAVLLPTGFPGLATYLIPSEQPLPPAGARVAVPFGPRLLTGLVVPGEPDPAPEGTVLREVLTVLDEEPFLSESFVGLLTR
ncbi:MAG: primosomal protein N', partial [Thermoanaerobaculia bacterium]|nr:primosomal protein N' [Thermoanaerobaculia bacterium]